MKILVTGATGNVGRHVVAALQSRGATVRAFVRDPAQAAPGVEVAVGDFEDPASVRRAVRGADAVFLTSADGPHKVEHEKAVIDAAATAWVPRIVKLSFLGAQAGADLPFRDWHGRIEEHLRESGVTAVCLRASFFMSNLFAAAGQIQQTGQLFAPAGDAKIAMVDPQDVADAAAVLLAEDGHDGETVSVTGPAAITYHDVAEQLSRVTGGEITYVDVPDDAARAAMLASGAPEWLAGGLVTLFGELRNGAGEEVTGAVPQLTGRPARTFAQWAAEHRQFFAGGS